MESNNWKTKRYVCPRMNITCLENIALIHSWVLFSNSLFRVVELLTIKLA